MIARLSGEGQQQRWKAPIACQSGEWKRQKKHAAAAAPEDRTAVIRHAVDNCASIRFVISVMPPECWLPVMVKLEVYGGGSTPFYSQGPTLRKDKV